MSILYNFSEVKKLDDGVNIVGLSINTTATDTVTGEVCVSLSEHMLDTPVESMTTSQVREKCYEYAGTVDMHGETIYSILESMIDEKNNRLNQSANVEV